MALDTNAYADLMRGSHWGQVVAEASEVLISATMYGELRYGFACGSREASNVKDLHEFLNHPAVRFCETDAPTAEQYGLLKAFLRKNGTPLPENDIWIAASCLINQATLLTRDKHFVNLPQVSVRWPDA
ncbi:type II toxin-antitoxin system VapC family toxin [Persicirhabdus sediminis]|uniref:type II toxin-antitoxin system VapC family toxin n=1 Tax=Persicirhabdus sediminis TaxID=454144 RepID=UPI002D7F9E2F|nr:type II toxin-antitoxin system VapC family toxin [Persicirhabdus sediminis]